LIIISTFTLGIFSFLFALNLLEDTLEVDALRSLDRQTQSSVPNQLGERAKTTRHTECGSVVQSLVEAVVVEQDSGAAIDVGVRVLGLAVLLENLRSNSAVLFNQLEDRVVGNLRTGSSIVHESLKSGVGLSENGVTIAGDDSARVECGPEVVVHILLGVVRGNSLLHLDDPSKHLLGGETKAC
jgi:hypothetical protein